MYFFRKIVGLFFLGLLIFGVLGLFRGSGRYDSAYRQGFIDGQQAALAGAEAAGAESGKTTIPQAPSGTNIYYRDQGFFFPGSAFLLCLVPLFAIGLMAMASGKRRRHGRRGHWGPRGSWGPCGPAHGPWKQGPWGRWQDEPAEKSPDDIDDGPAEPSVQSM